MSSYHSPNACSLLCIYFLTLMQVVTPNLFELHAGSSNKRPPEYIYLENGTSLRGVMNAWKNAALDSLDEAIRVAIGCSMIKKSTFCLNCKGCSCTYFLLTCSTLSLEDFFFSIPCDTFNHL